MVTGPDFAYYTYSVSDVIEVIDVIVVTSGSTAVTRMSKTALPLRNLRYSTWKKLGFT